MEQPIHISTFYKFAHLGDLDACRAIQLPLKREMIRRNIRGTITLAPEGVNATISGEADALHDMMQHLREEKPAIGAFEFKISEHGEQPFARSKVKVKPELISLGEPTDPTVCVGEYVDAADWNALISRPDVVTIDTRNAYEYRIGHFKGAVNPDTRKFKQMVAYTQTHLNPATHKAVAMYCTGGIRCEKYSSYLLAQGFEHVYHLKGGILQYLEEIPEAESLWEGACFVFDERVAVTHALAKDQSVTMCKGCGSPMLPTDVKYMDFFNQQQCAACTAAA